MQAKAFVAASAAGQRPAAGSPARGLPRTVGSFVPRLTRSAFERYGFSAATLITDWATIVGPDIARFTAPERLKWPRRVETSGDEVADESRGRPGATLILGVDAGRALDMQYRGRQIVERINAYFGYRAVDDLRIVQLAAMPEQRPAATVAPSPAAQQPTPRQELAGIAEPGLRAALERMAEGLVSRNCRRDGPR